MKNIFTEKMNKLVFNYNQKPLTHSPNMYESSQEGFENVEIR